MRHSFEALNKQQGLDFLNARSSYLRDFLLGYTIYIYYNLLF